MRKLRLVGLSSDLQHVVYVDDAGQEFAAPADDRLRAALRGDRARLGQLEIEMDSALRRATSRPGSGRRSARSGRAARRRAGRQDHRATASPSSPSAGTSPNLPVAATSAARTRRPAAASPTSSAATPPQPRRRPRVSRWDAWRRDDGRWIVQATYHSGGGSERFATFVYDAAGRYSLGRRRRGQVADRRAPAHQQGPAASARRASRRSDALGCPAEDDLLARACRRTLFADQDTSDDPHRGGPCRSRDSTTPAPTSAAVDVYAAADADDDVESDPAGAAEPPAASPFGGRRRPATVSTRGRAGAGAQATIAPAERAELGRDHARPARPADRAAARGINPRRRGSWWTNPRDPHRSLR